MASTTSTQEKPIHSLILDTGPLIKNAVSISTLINTAEELYTTPAILSEIRDAATRSRVQTTLMPFLKVRTPNPASYDAVISFSKKTGDHAVLSRQDLGILALAYEVHCERNGGNWGLRDVPKGEIKRRPEEIEEENARKAQKAQQEAESAEQEKADQGATEEGWSQPTKKRTRKRGGKKSGRSTDSAAEERAEEPALEQTETVEVEVAEEGWEQPTGKKVAKARAPKPTKFKLEPAGEPAAGSGEAQTENEQPVLDEAPDADGGIAITQEHVQEQIQEQIVAQVQDQIHEQVQDQIHEQLEVKDQEQLQDQAVEQAEQRIEQQVQEQVQKQLQQQVREEGQIQQSAAIEVPSTNIHIKQTAELSVTPQQQEKSEQPAQDVNSAEPERTEDLEQDMADLDIAQQPSQQLTPPATDSSASDDDSDGDWITPSNLNEHQIKDSGLQPHVRTAANRQMDSAAMTTDFAMQNVLLQMNLNLLSTNMQRIKHVTTKVFRCHACFNIVKDMTKQFCPRCGQSTLQRVSCSTNAKGEFKIHLARNYQYNKRGDKYSIPKPIAGTANTKWSGLGGGKGGWGTELILAEDQKEYRKKMELEKRSKAKDLMDEDYLPGILTGDRGRAGGRVKVGAGKNVNSRKRV